MLHPYYPDSQPYHLSPNLKNNQTPTKLSERCGVRAPDRVGLRLPALLGPQRHRAAGTQFNRKYFGQKNWLKFNFYNIS